MACSGVDSAKEILNEDKAINAVFSSSEVKQLNTLVELFENQICNQYNSSPNSISECYSRFFKKYQLDSDFPSFETDFDYKEQRKIVDQLSPELFDELWFVTPTPLLTEMPRDKDTKDKWSMLSLKTLHESGKYYFFINELAKEQHPQMVDYALAMRKAGDLSPSVVKSGMFNGKNYDFNHPGHRLMIALNCLTFVENHNRIKQAKIDKQK